MKKKKDLNPKTPHWFKDWHIDHFSPVDARTKRNEKWIYIIVTAIIATGVVTNGNAEELLSFIKNIISVF